MSELFTALLAPSNLLVTAIVAVLVWWIRGSADRRRAANDHIEVGERVTVAQFERMEAEIARQGARITKLEAEAQKKDEQIAENVKAAAMHAAEVIVLTAKLAAAEVEKARLQSLVDGKADLLVEATERNAKANERLADATEHSHDGGNAK